MAGPVSANFQFLERRAPLLLALAALAERYFAEDPVTALMKLRQFGEELAREVARCGGLTATAAEKQVDLLNRLRNEQLLPDRVRPLFHDLRIAGNAASHDGKGSHETALRELKFARQLAIWFHQTFHRPAHFEPGPFVPPADPRQESKALRDELEELRKQLHHSTLTAQQHKAVAEEEARQRLSAEERAQKNAEDSATWQKLAEEAAAEPVTVKPPTPAVQAAQVEAAQRFGGEIDLDEADTRHLIDQQLRDAGWEVDSRQLTWERGAKPIKGKNRAIAEWPNGGGRADYVLFCGLEVVGVVEAKRKRKDVPGSIEQARRYSEGYAPSGDETLVKDAPFATHHVPFLFATNGRPYLEQLKTKSGIWFQDARRPQNHAHPLQGWYTPDGLLALLRQDVDAAQKKLEDTPTDKLGLRPYQVEAIEAVEAALAKGQRECLIAMATGTGKTRTFIGLTYRLISSRRFRRILFLVDREALGEQALAAFENDAVDGLTTFAKAYDIKALKDLKPEPETKLHFATVQGMVKRILYPGPNSEVPPVDQYDCIVIDECHRGYTHDRELSEDELLFKNELDYLSKYRRVLEYFDAVKLGLTATPALHTHQIFGDPVFTYSYRDAVIDDYLVDHEPPIRIETELSKGGIHWARGEDALRLNLKTHRIDPVKLPDELGFQVDGFNTKVVTEGFNRVVCEELVKQIDPRLPGKTLIFCATDAHADLVVDLLKKALDTQYGALDDQTVMKITGASDKPLEKLRRFKNEGLPSIAVTVDLLTTGIDVPKISNLVFLRRVKSRILYEQMLGRATRLCPEIDKESFRIFDAVDLYAALEPFTSMKPVVVNPQSTFASLLKELEKAPTKAGKEGVLAQLVVKLQRKKRLFHDGENAGHFEAAAGMTLGEALKKLKEGPAVASNWLLAHQELVQLLDRVAGENHVWVAEHDDALREVSRGYGPGRQRPQDYLDGFGKFVRENINKIPALEVVTKRPRSLTRKQLKELKLLLDKAGYTELALQKAHQELTNEDIAASIVGFIRQRALGEPLVSYDDRVGAALKKILASKAWTHPQRQWLERIGKQLLKNEVLDREAFDSGLFADRGGFEVIDRAFNGKLKAVVGDLTDAVWAHAG